MTYFLQNVILNNVSTVFFLRLSFMDFPFSHTMTEYSFLGELSL